MGTIQMKGRSGLAIGTGPRFHIGLYFDSQNNNRTQLPPMNNHNLIC